MDHLFIQFLQVMKMNTVCLFCLFKHIQSVTEDILLIKMFFHKTT